jgi:hypothetical protein
MTRASSTVKLVLITATHASTCAAIAFSLSELLRRQSELQVMRAQYALALALIPNVLSFAVTAWLIRARWTTLRVAQTIAAGLFLGLLTVAMTLGFGSLSAFFSVSMLAMVVAPGIIAAQFLRLGATRQAEVPAA